MFTPQRGRKWLAGWGLSPRTGAGGRGGHVASPPERKAAAPTPPPPQPQMLLSEPGGGGGEADVWRSFREAGFLDEAVLERKEKEEMSRRIAALENELHDYQYNMGLLLIEKKEWTSKFEEIRCAMKELEEKLKREQSAHLISISKSEKREENLQKALEVEKQCVIDLEKALHDMQAEVARVNSTSDEKLAEAHALKACWEEKCLEIQSNLHSAGAKLAESNRKSSEVDRKLHDAEDYEHKLVLSLTTVQKTFEKDLAEQREHLRDWEKILQEGQKKLLEEQSALNEREQKANALERYQNEKDKELEEVHKKIEVASNSLKEKEDGINTRLSALSIKEKEADTKQINLEKKEEDLHELEKMLNAREKVESQLKEEIEDYRLMKESIVKQIDDLRVEREVFEVQREALDKKRKGLEIELKQVNDKRERFAMWQHGEEERLNIERQTAETELESLRLKKEDFENLVAHKFSQALEMLERERADMTRAFDLRKHELEISMQKKHEEMEKKIQEKEDFNKRNDPELNGTISSSSLNDLKAEKLKTEVEHFEREKEEISAIRKRLEAYQIEIQKNMDTIQVLNRNFNNQREEFIKEREHFLAIAEQCKACKNCRVAIGDLELLALEQIIGIENAGNVLLPTAADGLLKENTETSPQGTDSKSVASLGDMLWLKRCTMLSNSSPGKRADLSRESHDRGGPEDEADYEPEQYFDVANDSQQARSNRDIRENENSERFDNAGDDPQPSLVVAYNSIDILRFQLENDFREREREPVVPSINEQNQNRASSLAPSDLQPQASNERRRQPSRRGKPKLVRRTHSMKAVVEDAKEILGVSFEDNKYEQPHGDASEMMSIHEGILGDMVHADQEATNSRQRKCSAHVSGIEASERDAEDNEEHSDSISFGHSRKRLQSTSPRAQTPGAKRYNLRRSTIHSSSRGSNG